jgi:cyanophycinase
MGDEAGIARRGWIFAIGGAEEREPDRATLRRYLAVAGGGDARILLIEFGPERARGPALAEQLAGVSGSTIDSFLITNEAELRGADLAIAARGATGYYLAGAGGAGTAEAFAQSDAGRAILAGVQEGRALAATGAATLLLGEQGVTGGGQVAGPTPSKGYVALRPGLSLLPGLVFDASQAPTRIVRLITAIAQNPFLLGVGLDETTTAAFAPDGVLEVSGAGAVTLIDGSGVGYSNYFALKQDQPIGLAGGRAHIFTHGMCFDLVQRAYIYPENERTHKRLSAAAEARALSR